MVSPRLGPRYPRWQSVEPWQENLDTRFSLTHRIFWIHFSSVGILSIAPAPSPTGAPIMQTLSGHLYARIQHFRGRTGAQGPELMDVIDRWGVCLLFFDCPHRDQICLPEKWDKWNVGKHCHPSLPHFLGSPPHFQWLVVVGGANCLYSSPGWRALSALLT